MKKSTAVALISAVALILLAPVAMAQGSGCGGCSKGGGQGKAHQGGQDRHQGYQVVLERLETLPVGSLSNEEVKALVYLREEEKLSRDVYRTLDEKWDRKVFSNIAGAEQRHLDLLEALLARYEIEDPIVDDATGAFTNRELGELYTELVSSGEASLEAAFRVGAAIEDKDIFDLYALIESSDNADVKLVANNLVKGSRNHLRAFSKNLSKQGADAYQAQHLEQTAFDEIASSEWERGVIYDENGAKLAGFGGHGGGKGHGEGQGKGQGKGHGGHGKKGGCKNATGS